MLRPSHRLALAFVATLAACTADRRDTADAEPKQSASAAEATHPMASFARFVGGEWNLRLASGEVGAFAWHFGPGRFSLRRMTHASDAFPNSFEGEILYWHPGLREVRFLSMHGDIPAVGRGVAEGSIRFEGESTLAGGDLYQPRGPRQLGQRQVFEGPDKYHEVLLEDTGAGLRPLAEWDFFRVPARTVAPPRTAQRSPIRLPERFRAFEALVDGTWEVDGKDGGRMRSRFEWVPALEVVFVRITAVNAGGDDTQVFEAYVYHHLGADVLRCLALSDRGSVHEGDVTVLEQGGLQLDLKGYEGDRVVSRVVRFDVEQGGSLRTRVWSLASGARTLALDVLHEKLELQTD